jgi:predicted DNA-binding transcriptional regulator YafY
MPSANHETTLARQWELLKMLPSRGPGLTSRYLRDQLENAGHDVSKRTVERDLSELSRVFPILSNEISKPFGWHWKPGARVDFPGIDLAEAVSLGLLEDLLRQMIPPSFTEALEGRFAAAREKLKSLSQNRHAKWSDLIRYEAPGLPLHKPSIKPGVSRAVQEALIRKLQLKVHYRGPGSTTHKELLLHPLAIIQQGERAYLLATTFDYADVLYYALHRMHAAEILDDPSKHPAHFSLDTFLAHGGGLFGDGKTISLKARVTDSLATILQETAIASDQKITTRAGKNTLTATVKDSWQLHFWILSQGQAITIVQPTSLRKDIIGKLQVSLANYQS